MNIKKISLNGTDDLFVFSLYWEEWKAFVKSLEFNMYMKLVILQFVFFNVIINRTYKLVDVMDIVNLIHRYILSNSITSGKAKEWKKLVAENLSWCLGRNSRYIIYTQNLTDKIKIYFYICLWESCIKKN